MGEVIQMGGVVGAGLSPAEWARLHVLAKRQGITAGMLAGQLLALKLGQRKRAAG